MKKKAFQLSLLFILFVMVANAQKGNNQLQFSGQAAIPIADLANIAKVGGGIAAKGMYGFSKSRQQVTLEAGYNLFGVKGLPSTVTAHYSALPIYTGYRYVLGGVILESQAGLSFNRIAAVTGGQLIKESQTVFAWAFTAGYVYKSVELTVKYQSSEIKKSDENLNFIGIRLGYNFSL